MAEDFVTEIIAKTQRCDSQCQTTEPSVVIVAVQTDVYMGHLSNFSTEDLRIVLELTERCLWILYWKTANLVNSIQVLNS